MPRGRPGRDPDRARHRALRRTPPRGVASCRACSNSNHRAKWMTALLHPREYAGLVRGRLGRGLVRRRAPSVCLPRGEHAILPPDARDRLGGDGTEPTTSPGLPGSRPPPRALRLRGRKLIVATGDARKRGTGGSCLGWPAATTPAGCVKALCDDADRSTERPRAPGGATSVPGLMRACRSCCWGHRLQYHPAPVLVGLLGSLPQPRAESGAFRRLTAASASA